LCGALVAGRLESGLVCLAVSAIGAGAARATWPPRRWRVTLAISVGVGWLLNLYLTPGTPLNGWPALAGRMATREGLGLGALLGVRLLGAMVALQGLRALWPGERAADAVAGALRPLERFGLPVRDTRTLLGLALRFAPTVEDEARRIAAMQALRAGGAARGWRARVTRWRAAAVPTMVCTLERAERVALALEARHYRLRPARPEPSGSGAGWPWVVAGGMLFGGALWWR
jgi:energy-coupling factor transporter transmembrane protein EcfT